MLLSGRVPYTFRHVSAACLARYKDTGDPGCSRSRYSRHRRYALNFRGRCRAKLRSAVVGLQLRVIVAREFYTERLLPSAEKPLEPPRRLYRGPQNYGPSVGDNRLPAPRETPIPDSR